jgi:predicted nucleotidyltransferase
VYKIDKNRFVSAMKKAGFSSIQDLADFHRLHRNTIHYYLSTSSVITGKLETLLDAINLPLFEAVVKVEDQKPSSFELIAPVIDGLHEKYSDVTLVLFGSRAKSRHRNYSDWDIGAYRKDGLDHKTYRAMRLYVSEQQEKLPYFIELVNLNRASKDFLINASSNWKFLAGKQVDWLEINRKVKDG